MQLVTGAQRVKSIRILTWPGISARGELAIAPIVASGCGTVQVPNFFKFLAVSEACM
jgi:hypothetical protein